MKRFTVLSALLFSLAFAMNLFAQSSEDLELKQTLEQAYRNSNEIHARFDSRFFWDESQNVRVNVESGVVTLRGIVQTDEAKRTFIQIAEETPGVKEVKAKIRVIPSARKVD